MFAHHAQRPGSIPSVILGSCQSLFKTKNRHNIISALWDAEARGFKFETLPGHLSKTLSQNVIKKKKIKVTKEKEVHIIFQPYFTVINRTEGSYFQDSVVL